MRVLFATAELRPLVSAGGLGEAAAGLTAALASLGVDVITALPAYSHWPLQDEIEFSVPGPEWAGQGAIRLGHHRDAGMLAIVDGPGIARPDPYVDSHGQGWADNDLRFAAFSASVASLASELQADIVHLNDWHTGLALAFLPDGIPTVLTIHNLGHQGWADRGWLERLPRHGESFARDDAINMLAGAIGLADRVVAVSPNYASEIVTVEGGVGLNDVLLNRGSEVLGILNGIDTRAWNPSTDPHTAHFDVDHLDQKRGARQALLDHVGWDDNGEPVVGMVTRLVDQKGVDLAFAASRFLEGMQARMVILGSGEPELSRLGRDLAAAQPDRLWFHDGYDGPLSHMIFAGADLFLMPSRFEPCGLAQMQAMAYGTIPIGTPVGGLSDTIIDADRSPDGNGFLADGVDDIAVVDALHRALRALRTPQRRIAIQRQGMTHDWSWAEPARRYLELYRRLLDPV